MPLKLAVTEHRDPDCVVVGLTGDLDASTTPMARTRLHDLLAEGRTRLVLDVTGLAFCDSGGVWLLLEVHRRARESGGWMRMAGAQGFLRRLLDLTHLTKAFDLTPDLPTALREARRWSEEEGG
ncbi:STAS domain-containing protein [Sphaerisporangium fuscum]|uniref:STAS domain-containing protein n=1 Tax=Sphaerisporangium fuscum TaxID=2835868 RepID=UPI001BDCB175|nr:STAS domain-containing protein [Sphaerisporangium fuscum]